MTTTILACLSWSIASGMAVYPHSISYFNEVAGGPSHGHRLMLHSSFSWTHEHFYLRRWLQMHPEVEAPYMSLGRSVSLECLGIRNRGEPPRCSPRDLDGARADPYRVGPVPGWHVMGLQQIHKREDGYSYFQRLVPVAKIGYSVNIYHISHDEANRVRGEMGVPRLPTKHVSPEHLVRTMQRAADSTCPIHVALFVGVMAEPIASMGIQDILNRGSHVSTSRVTARDICAGKLQDCDVVLVPGGRASEQGLALGGEGRKAIRDFVRKYTSTHFRKVQ